MSQTLNVHVRVNDADTGRPSAVRIRIAGLDGRYYPPLGHAVDFPVGRNEDVGGHVYVNGQHQAYIDGSCEIPLPTGVPLELEISKGPSYTPIRETVTLGAGQLTLRYPIGKRTDTTWNHMVAVDSRCHFLLPDAAKREAEAEGLDFVNLLATVQDYPSVDGHMYRTTPNLLAFSGQAPSVERVYVNTFHEHPALGKLALLNCHRPIFPLTFGHMDETDDWSLADWCDQCHRKKGLVVWCDAYRQEAGLPGGEALIDAILGKIDAIEIDAHARATSFLPQWYRLLNAGIRLPVVGGSGKDSNRIALGGVRTLTPTGETRTYSEWIETVHAGRTIASNGPLLRWAIDGQPFRTSVATTNDDPVRFSAEMASNEPIERFEIIANGLVIASSTSERIEVEHRLPEGGWLAARCWSTAKSRLYPHVPIFAHTSPIWVNAARRSPSAVNSLLREIEGVRQWIETTGRFAIAKRKEHLLSLCDGAERKLSEPS
ncbi:MAG: hypothetical protein EXS09_12730 [Gemmataceae bacterium]|nr:hypothetical protein [Gemmataceae bacterium]